MWNKIPEQAKRLLGLVVILGAMLVTARYLMVPKDFGKYGHFRASAVDEVVAQEIQYAGHAACVECHDDVAAVMKAGYHKNVTCEVCHGPSAAHAKDPGSGKPPAPRERGSCPLCHEYLSSRPTGFPQIVAASHNPMKPCIGCHNPHDPKTPEPPKECSACHASIARTLSLSHHVYLGCQRCHETPEEHKLDPRQNLPSKPATREFCGECHAQDATVEKTIPRVDMATHGQRYVCWKCHYPHMPEAK